MKRTIAGAVLGALVAAAAPQAETPPRTSPGAGTDALAAELAALNTSLQELVVLTRRQVEGQQRDLLMKRIDLEARGLQPLRDLLRNARAEREGLGQEREQLIVIGDQTEQRIRDAQAKGSATDADQRMREEFTMRMKMVEDRIWAVDQRILDLEQDVTQASRLIDIWKERIDAHLGLR